MNIVLIVCCIISTQNRSIKGRLQLYVCVWVCVSTVVGFKRLWIKLVKLLFIENLPHHLFIHKWPKNLCASWEVSERDGEHVTDSLTGWLDCCLAGWLTAWLVGRVVRCEWLDVIGWFVCVCVFGLVADWLDELVVGCFRIACALHSDVSTDSSSQEVCFFP